MHASSPLCRTSLLIALAFGAAFVAGCSTVNSRVSEKQAVFDKLPADKQAKIKEGIVELGDTPDMVYMALGTPDQRREVVRASGRELVWVYATYYRDYEGDMWVGYHRRMYYDPFLPGYRLACFPIHEPVYSEHTEDRIRVIFADGKVTSIETTES